MILFIDASQPEAHLALIGKKTSSVRFVSQKISENLLTNIQKLLKKNKLNYKNLEKIAVVTGPGPFSRMRTAVVTANALAFSLNIPVIGIEADKIPQNLSELTKLSGSKQVMPFYHKPPNITKSKKKW
jgi:tRNA threonylcarbamoyl adenosine modification protein YeaZ